MILGLKNTAAVTTIIFDNESKGQQCDKLMEQQCSTTKKCWLVVFKQSSLLRREFESLLISLEQQ